MHLTITYDTDNLIRDYHNGQPYGRPYKKSELTRFQTRNCQILVNLHHDSPSKNRLLRNIIYKTRLHLRALSTNKITTSATNKTFVAHQNVLTTLNNQNRQHINALQNTITNNRSKLEQMDKNTHPNKS